MIRMGQRWAAPRRPEDARRHLEVISAKWDAALDRLKSFVES